MTSANEYIRLDFKDDGRFVSFPEAMLRAIGRLLPDAKFDVTVGNRNATETVEKISALDLPTAKLLRTIAIKKDDVNYDFLTNLLKNNGDVASNITVTDFVRLTEVSGKAEDKNSSTFALKDYVERNAGVEIPLKGAALTRFENPKASFVDRFFGSTAGTMGTMGAIVAGVGALNFSALKEQRDDNKPERSEDKVVAIIGSGQKKAGERVIAPTEENQR